MGILRKLGKATKEKTLALSALVKEKGKEFVEKRKEEARQAKTPEGKALKAKKREEHRAKADAMFAGKGSTGFELGSEKVGLEFGLSKKGKFEFP